MMFTILLVIIYIFAMNKLENRLRKTKIIHSEHESTCENISQIDSVIINKDMLFDYYKYYFRVEHLMM